MITNATLPYGPMSRNTVVTSSDRVGTALNKRPTTSHATPMRTIPIQTHVAHDDHISPIPKQFSDIQPQVLARAIPVMLVLRQVRHLLDYLHPPISLPRHLH